MKNLKYFPYERNRYYYGKLLGEQDFVDEQRYINDKRRLINRIFHGAGVAAGLQVVAVDEKNISVEAGLALDFSGREILVDVPVIRRLSTIEGFDALAEQGGRQYIYLYIEYDEEEIVPAHNVMGGLAGQEDRVDYEKYREGYRLYLTDQEPETPVLTRQNLVNQKAVIYRDDQIRITQTLPRFAESGTVFETSVTVENAGEGTRVSGTIREELSCGDADGRQFLDISFEEALLESGGSITKTFRVKAASISRGKVELHAEPGRFAFKTDRGALELSEEKTLAVSVAQGSLEEEIDQIYYKNLMEDIVRDDYPQGICLARIQLIHHEKTYLIDGVESVLPGQYISGTPLLKNRLELAQRRNPAGAAPYGDQASAEHRRQETEKTGPAVKSGRVEISLGIGAKRGQRCFSHEIFHGLGLGPVDIWLSLEEEQTLYSGSSEVFEEMQVKAELASKVNMEKGSFTVGLRMLEPTAQQKAVVYWRAEALAERTAGRSDKKKLYIRPERLEMKVRENAWLEAVCPGVPGITVLWNVKTPEGGSITQDGMYTSPSLPGVYEITASCQEMPELKTSIFVIVRE